MAGYLLWLHCNACGLRGKNGGHNFLLTSCGHIFCAKCTHKLNGSCYVCKKKEGVKYLPIDQSLPPTQQFLFRDAASIVNHHQKENWELKAKHKAEADEMRMRHAKEEKEVATAQVKCSTKVNHFQQRQIWSLIQLTAKNTEQISTAFRAAKGTIDGLKRNNEEMKKQVENCQAQMREMQRQSVTSAVDTEAHRRGGPFIPNGSEGYAPRVQTAPVSPWDESGTFAFPADDQHISTANEVPKTPAPVMGLQHGNGNNVPYRTTKMGPPCQSFAKELLSRHRKTVKMPQSTPFAQPLPLPTPMPLKRKAILMTSDRTGTGTGSSGNKRVRFADPTMPAYGYRPH